MTTETPTVYLAGFDVFRRDAIAHGKQLQAWCREHGLEGLYPLDNAAPPALRGRALAHWICQANLALIERADAVMANLNPFRGHEPDSGTVFEVGYACALGKPVWVYTDEARPLVEQVQAGRDGDGQPLDAQGYTVEDFGLNLNLMIACTTQVVVGSPQDCLRHVAAGLQSAARLT